MQKTIRRALAVSAAVIGLSASSGAQAWGPEGHSLIMHIAYNGLAKPLQQRFDAIMAGGDIDHAYDHFDRKKGRMVHENCQAHNLDQLANWADCVRYDKGNPHFASTAAYHFDDIPLCGAPPKSEYCKDGACGTEALKHYYGVLRDARRPANERLEALAWVVHLVGDLHQPLHSITNGTPESSDNGGNGVVVTGPGGAPNLHSFWDSGLIRLSYATPAAALQSLTADAKAKEAAWGSQMNPDLWARDAHAIASEAYAGLKPPPPCNAKSFRTTIDQNYVNRFKPKVRQQLGMAAVRLRNLLRSALS
jgi:hypothetical protein